MKSKLLISLTCCIILFTSCISEVQKSTDYSRVANPFIVLKSYESFNVGSGYACIAYVLEDTLTHKKYLYISSGRGGSAITEYQE